MAIKHFVLSNTDKVEVPRMLTELRDFDRLQQFVQGKREPELMKWWAQYLEAQGMLQEALGFYREAQDFGSVVRLLCMVGDS
jgi:intraflagellar transport protein 140